MILAIKICLQEIILREHLAKLLILIYNRKVIKINQPVD